MTCLTPGVDTSSIRPATAADIPLIRERLSELRHPPYYPDDQSIQELTDTEVFVVDPELEAISDWVRAGGIIRGRYVLPASMTFAQMVPLLAASWQECIARWPETATWRVEGDFESYELPSGQDNNEVRCRAWRIALTVNGDGPRTDSPNADGGHCISWILEEALARAESIVIPS